MPSIYYNVKNVSPDIVCSNVTEVSSISRTLTAQPTPPKQNITSQVTIEILN